MEMDTFNTLLDILSKFGFQYAVQVGIVRQCTVLMELPEQPVELVRGVVKYELVPVVALG